MIWSFSLPQPRIVSIRCDSRSVLQRSPRDGVSHIDRQIQCWSPSPVPTNLHVCRESRSEALRHYKLLFGIRGETGKIYFDPLKDTLYFGAHDGGVFSSEANRPSLMPLIDLSDKLLVRHVAVNEILVRGRKRQGRSAAAPTTQHNIEQLVCEVRARFRNLERLTFVCGDRNPIYSPDSVFVEPLQRSRLLEREIKSAVDTIVEWYPTFNPPPWEVKAIAAEPSQLVCDWQIVGFRRRWSSFQSRHGVRRSWPSQQCACNCCDSYGRDLRLSCM